MAANGVQINRATDLPATARAENVVTERVKGDLVAMTHLTFLSPFAPLPLLAILLSQVQVGPILGQEACAGVRGFSCMLLVWLAGRGGGGG